MKIHLKDNVFDATLDRIRYLFDEFDNVVISNSGGKDSTIIQNLVLMVAEERNRLPVKMVFLDQEAEYRMTIEHMRIIMADPRVEPIWIQCPIKLFNATSMHENWLMCWEEGKEWMRPKEDIAVKENVFGTERFHDMFPKIMAHYFPNEKACYLAGVRAEESPSRHGAVTIGGTYKHITYGKVLNKKKEHYTFYPIYDWCLSDVWKAIYDHDWPYCKIYDELYRYGMAPHKMRVSNLHHETAVHSLFFLHELEGDTWDALTKRLSGVNQSKHMKKSEMFSVGKLPFMFSTWREYRDYLTDNLITNEKYRGKFRRKWAKMDELYDEHTKPEELVKQQIKSLLVNDHELVRLDGYENSPPMIAYRHWKWGRINERVRTPAHLVLIPEGKRNG